MSELQRVVSTVALGALSAAIVFLLLAPAVPAPLPAFDVDWTPVHRLEARVEDLEKTPAPEHSPRPRPSVPERVEPRIDVGADVMRRLERIEARLLRLEQVAAAAQQGQRDQGREPPPDKDKAARRIVDPASDVATKVRAHQDLRGVPDAYSPAMVAELLKIGTMNPDGRVRAEVWCFFDGKSRLPAIVAPLVRALQADADARAREEAADTLGSYLDDPIVEPALRQAADSDPSERVRAKANRTLRARRSFSPVGQVSR